MRGGPLGLLFGLLLGGCVPAQASGPIGVDLCSAELVLVGQVQGVAGYHHTLDGQVSLLSDVTLESVRRFHGSVPAELVLTYEGGEVGTEGLSVSTSPRMREGQRWLLFLDQSPHWSTPFILHARQLNPGEVLPGEGSFRRLWSEGCGP